MLGFVLGTLFGSTVGVAAICFCKAASEADERMNRTDFKE